MADNSDQLSSAIADHVAMGAFDASGSLGIQNMPEGYALMLNADRTHYYWLRFDGIESVISWNKWDIYRWARKDSKCRCLIF